jgi:DNA-binding PadR family transcriptional regulator
MEERDPVKSRWDTGNAGPASRVYQTTEEGGHYVASWVDDLRQTDRVLHHFIQTYGSYMEAHAGQ